MFLNTHKFIIHTYIHIVVAVVFGTFKPSKPCSGISCI